MKKSAYAAKEILTESQIAESMARKEAGEKRLAEVKAKAIALLNDLGLQVIESRYNNEHHFSPAIIVKDPTGEHASTTYDSWDDILKLWS